MKGGDVLGEASKINKTEREGPGAGQDDALPGDLRRHKSDQVGNRQPKEFGTDLPIAKLTKSGLKSR